MSLTQPSNQPRRERVLALLCGVYFLVILDASIYGMAFIVSLVDRDG